MVAAELQQSGRAGFLGGKAGNAVDRLGALFVAGQVGGSAFYTENLADIGKVQIVVERCAGADLTDFQSSVGFIDSGVFRGEKRSS
jgi:hypothetical protein